MAPVATASLKNLQQELFLGLEVLVIGVIANVTLNLGQQAIKGRIEVFMALAAFIAMLFKVKAILVHPERPRRPDLCKVVIVAPTCNRSRL